MNNNEERVMRLERRNKAIKDMYMALSSKKKNGVKLYSQEYIMATIADKFYMAQKSVEDIIFERVKYKS